jgi:hypothetical protein
MLNVIYRLCELEADGRLRPHRPDWFSKTNCLQSFFLALSNATEHVGKVVFVHDGEGDILLNQIPKDFELVKINANSNAESLYKTFDVADEIGGNIYFVEDDYLHLPQSIKKIDIVLPKYKLVNGYDHSDRYTRTDDINYPLRIDFDFNSNHHWRTAESTCCTYAVEEETWKQISPVIRKYGLDDRGLFRHLHGLSVPLWTALPGITSQIDTNMSPGVDWKGFNNSL